MTAEQDTAAAVTIRQNLIMAQAMLKKATADLEEAIAAATQNNMNGAIGASLNIPADLDTARSLVDAAMTLNRYRSRP